MASKPLNGILKRIRTLAEVQTGRGLTDQDLLTRFIDQHDEAAFTVLIERHGPMVLGVCKRALRNAHDAEDACQATFLVFARKADSIRNGESLTCWLHGVACRIAANLKRSRVRQRLREHHVATPIEHVNVEPNWLEMQTVLDEELELLPLRYRTPLLLCYWEGKTRDEAAAQLAMTAGKLHGLLERGRELLRNRLTRRGLTLSAALCSGLLIASTSQAALDPSLVIASTKAALLLATTSKFAQGVVSSQVITLTKEALQTMFITKLKVVTASILSTGLVIALIGGSLAGIGSAQNPKTTLERVVQTGRVENDEAFIRRMSKDLRGTDPTPAEMHFFVTNKDDAKRQKLIDLFIQERQAKQNAAVPKENQALRLHMLLDEHRKAARKTKIENKFDPKSAQGQLELDIQRLQREIDALREQELKKAADQEKLRERQQRDFLEKALQIEEIERQREAERKKRVVEEDLIRSLQLKIGTKNRSSLDALKNDFFRSLLASAKERKDVTAITQAYLESLQNHVKANPKSADAPEAMLQIELVYRALGKTAEANAWRERLQEMYPNSAAAKTKVSLRSSDQGEPRELVDRIFRVYLDVDLIKETTPGETK